MGRFWIDDDFIDSKAKDLTIYEQMTFVALSRFANKEGNTFVGTRHIASCLGINKDTVSKAEKGLILSGSVGQVSSTLSGLRTLTVLPQRLDCPKASDIRNVSKESIKEVFVKSESLDRIWSSVFGVRSSVMSIN